MKSYEERREIANQFYYFIPLRYVLFVTQRYLAFGAVALKLILTMNFLNLIRSDFIQF